MSLSDSAERLLQQVFFKHTSLTLVSGPAVLRLVVGRYTALYLREKDRLRSQCGTFDLAFLFYNMRCNVIFLSH